MTVSSSHRLRRDGDMGAHGVRSVTRSTSGMPYTAADEEKTNDATPAAVTASRSTRSPSTFSR